MCSLEKSGTYRTIVEPDLEYAVRDGASLAGTLYRPAGLKSVPVVVAVHGGAWKSGSKTRYEHWGRWLSARGLAVFAIDYRLALTPETRFPACLVDVMAAVRFIHESAQRYDIDQNRIALMGDSAGAHLVSLAALTNDTSHVLEHANPFQPPIRAVVSVYGVYDLFAQWEHDQIARPRDQITEGLIGVSPLDDKFAFFRASPVAYTSTRAPRTAFMIAWGTDDDTVDWASQSARFVKELKQSGQFVRPVPVVGAPHFWINQPIDEPDSFTGFLAPKLFRFFSDKL